jgi:hypothetical protein
MNDVGGNQSLRKICGENAVVRFREFFTNVWQVILTGLCPTLVNEGKMKTTTMLKDVEITFGAWRATGESIALA